VWGEMLVLAERGVRSKFKVIGDCGSKSAFVYRGKIEWEKKKSAGGREKRKKTSKGEKR